VSVTGKTDDGIPHGLKGARKPYYCDCPICKAAINKYNREGRARRKQQRQTQADELSAKREARYVKSQGRVRTAKPVKRTESDVSVSKAVGAMESAVIKECEGLARAVERPALVVAARNLAKIVDTPKMSSIHTTTTKQIMAILADLHGDKAKTSATGRKKSGGRLATVGNLTKVKRAQ
jgi:hypothetical protein